MSPVLSLLASLCIAPAHADEAEWKALHAPRAESSSYLRSNWNKFTENYHPTYILDDNPSTAWVEGAPGDGLGSWVSWPVSRVAAAHRVKLRLRNGYHKSNTLLSANAAPSRIAIELVDGNRTRFRQEFDVDRSLTWQEVVLDPPQDVAIDGIKLTVLQAHKGSAYQDTCISDVQTFVDADDPYNAVVERSKQAAAKTWIAGRVKAAEAYANVPKTYPWASTRFEHGPSITEAEVDAAIEQATATIAEAKAARPRIDALLADPRWFRHDVARFVPMPDGLPLEEIEREHLWRWFAPESSYFETDKPWRVYRKDDRDWLQLAAIGNVKIEAGDDGAPKALAYSTRTVIQERTVDTSTTDWLVLFDGPHATRIIALETASDEFECTRLERTEVYDITWVQEAVHSIRRTEQSHCLKPAHRVDDSPEEPSLPMVLTWVPVP